MLRDITNIEGGVNRFKHTSLQLLDLGDDILASILPKRSHLDLLACYGATAHVREFIEKRKSLIVEIYAVYFS